MCGIVGYVGSQTAADVILDGLGRLEYRGYDSAGIAVRDADGELKVRRKAGKLAMLRAAIGEESFDSSTGIGHTRWATHGGPTDENAHPHLSCDGSVAVVHNGIIENYVPLRAALELVGHTFTSETDTEVVAHLLEDAYAGDLADAMRSVCQRLEGAFTLVAVHRATPDVVVGARRNSPLVVGVGKGEMFLGSDVSAFIEHTRDALEIGQDEVVIITPDGASVTTFTGEPVVPKPFHVDWDVSAAEKGGHPFFMLKEIEEQPRAVRDTLRGRVDERGMISMDELRMSDQDFRDVTKIFIVGCGSAYHAGLIAKYAIEHWCRVSCEVDIASEFRYRDPVLDRTTLVIAISQSGETADTLRAVEHARRQKARVVAVTNSVGSTLAREADAVLYTRAGPEVSVASTKTFLTQITAIYLVALYLAQTIGVKYPDEVVDIVRELGRIPDHIATTLSDLSVVRQVALELKDSETVLFLGRHVGYPMALEGALKLKELTYIHAEGFPAGELKHGPIALVEQGTPVVVVALKRDRLYEKILSNIAEVRARGAYTIVIAAQDDELIDAYSDVVVRVPSTPVLLSPLVTAIPLQVLSCEVALAKGLDVDQPRNLAKSVTVE